MAKNLRGIYLYGLLYFLKNHFLDMLTAMEKCRPQNLNMYVKFDIESDVFVEKTYVLRLA